MPRTLLTEDHGVYWIRTYPHIKQVLCICSYHRTPSPSSPDVQRRTHLHTRTHFQPHHTTTPALLNSIRHTAVLAWFASLKQASAWIGVGFGSVGTTPRHFESASANELTASPSHRPTGSPSHRDREPDEAAGVRSLAAAFRTRCRRRPSTNRLREDTGMTQFTTWLWVSFGCTSQQFAVVYGHPRRSSDQGPSYRRTLAPSVALLTRLLLANELSHPEPR